MPTYQSIAVRYDPSDGTNNKRLYKPTPLYAGLIQALRCRAVITNTGTPEAPMQAYISIVTASESGFIIGVVPMPPTGESTYYDLMPYLSNLANYGLSPTDEITIRTTETLQSGDSLRIWGFSIEGLEE